MHPAYCIALTGLATAKFVRDGSPKKDRVAYLTALLSMYENCDPRHVDELVTGDETWLYYSEPLRKAMEKKSMGTKRLGHTPNRKAMQLREECMLYNIFFYANGIVLQKPCKAGKIITGDCYRDCLLLN